MLTNRIGICVFISVLAFQTGPVFAAQSNPSIDPVIGITYKTGISADGSVIVGETLGAPQTRIVRWTKEAGASDLGTIAGYDPNLYFSAMNTDGSTIVGYGIDNFGNQNLIRWTSAGGLEDLGALNGGSMEASAISNNGGVIVGSSDLGPYHDAWRWTAAHGLERLDTLTGNNNDNYATGVSGDGSTIIGRGYNSSLDYEAWYWTEANGTQTLGSLGGDDSSAAAISWDGSVIAGIARDGNGTYQVYRWTQSNGMQSIGDLGGGIYGSHNFGAMTSDGRVIIGNSDNGTYNEAFRWTVDGGMQGLGALASNNPFSSADAMSADGSVIAGISDGGAGLGYTYFRWTEETGMRSLVDILTDGGIDLSGWDFSYVDPQVFVTADGTKIIGSADYHGNEQTFIFTTGGLITPEELQESLTPVASAKQQLEGSIVNGMGQSMMVARNAMTMYFPGLIAPAISYSDISNITDVSMLNSSISPSASPRYDLGRKRRAVFAVGNFGIGQDNEFDNNSTSGNTGVLFQVANHTAVGVGVIGSTNKQEMRLGGESRTNALGGNIIAAYEPPSGIRLYGTASVVALDASTKRNYINGGGLDGSKGETNGMGYGVAVRAGYEFELTDKTAFMPYTELQWSHTKLNGYTETGGGFPATIGDQTGNSIVSRFGGEVSHDLNQKFTIRGRAAWGHRYTDPGSIVATSTGITQVIPGTEGDRDWAEVGTTLNYKMSDRMTLSFDVSGRSGHTAEPMVNATAGLIWRW